MNTTMAANATTSDATEHCTPYRMDNVQSTKTFIDHVF